MPAERSFQDLLARVRTGDEEASAELMGRYEPIVRRIIRLKLTDPRLRAIMGSVDICQSVMANFFVRAAAGQFELDTPEQLLKLLSTMARNRLLHHVEKHRAARRDVRRQEAVGEALEAVAGRQETPSQIVCGAELLARARELLAADERDLAERRARGEEWVDVAQALGSTPEALRKKLARAMDRVVGELGLGPPEDTD